MSKNTHVKHVQTDSVSDVSLLLDLGGLAGDRIEWDTFVGRVVHVVTADESACACPSCGVFSTSVKALVCTRPRDIPYGVRGLRLIWHKRRWRCGGTAVPAAFVHRVPARDRGAFQTDYADAVRARVRGRRTGPGRLGVRSPLRRGLVHRARRVRGPCRGATATGERLGH